MPRTLSKTQLADVERLLNATYREGTRRAKKLTNRDVLACGTAHVSGTRFTKLDTIDCLVELVEQMEREENGKELDDEECARLVQYVVKGVVDSTQRNKGFHSEVFSLRGYPDCFYHFYKENMPQKGKI